jgi:hypothetical protein
MVWATIVAGVIKAWNNVVKVLGWVREIGIYLKGRKDQAREQEDAEDEERQDALSEKRKAEDASDDEIRRRLRGDDPA